MKHRILCFGDSNTYGWKASPGAPASRYPSSVRWTGRLAALLGPEWEVVEEGLGGRTLQDRMTEGSGIPVPGAGLSAAEYLPPCLLSHLPLDIVVIMLGSNDMKAVLRRSEHDIAEGMARLADTVLHLPWQGLLDYPHPELMIVSPPFIGERKMRLSGERYAGAPEKSRLLAGLYRSVADRCGAAFLDAATVLAGEPYGEAHGEDGMHLSEEDHAGLAAAVWEMVKEMLPGSAPSAISGNR